MLESSTGKLVDHLFREEAGKMVAVLSRKLGLANLDLAHDIIQDTLLAAMTSWRFGNIPNDPKAWLYRVARNKAIDYLRRDRSASRVQVESIRRMDTEAELLRNDLFLEHEVHDSVLRMMFACCHPAIPVDSQIALALRTIGGMTSREIANAFLTSEETIQKRIYRAREKIKAERIALEVPVSQAIQPRLQAVAHVLYLLFNEGYHSSASDNPVRLDLCFEALRLCHLLAGNRLTDLPLTNALLALMCFQASRLESRVDVSGNLVTLKYQNREKWDRTLIGKGVFFLDRAAQTSQLSIYHLEAGIASIHAASTSFESTDWKSIYHLYEVLYAAHPTPVVALNKAIASSYAISARVALDELQQIRGMEKNSFYHASLGEVCLDLGRREEARNHFLAAQELTQSTREKHFFQMRMDDCVNRT
jgi:RNA polymerase sigma factor (sigma-70 family)